MIGHRNLDAEVYFEPGSHPLDAATQNKIYNETLDGSVNVHEWNEAVRERMRSYSPSIIAVDSMLPIGIDEAEQLNTAAKANLWTLMPGTPSQINGSDEILVVAGDNTYNFPDNGNDLENRELITMNYLGLVIAAYRAGKAIDRRLPPKIVAIEQPQILNSDEIYDWYEKGDFIFNQDTTTIDTAPEYQMVSRRGFLGKSAATLALLAIGSDAIAAYSPWRFTEHIAADADKLVESVSLDRIVDPDNIYEYVGGRTALLISKIHDAINMFSDRLPSSVGSVVMGDAHFFQAYDLLADPQMRDAYMRRHTELMLKVAKVSNASFGGHWTPLERQNWVMQNEASMQIFRVLEPDDKRFKLDPQAEINRIVNFEATVTSPSAAAAVSGLLKVPGI